MAYQIIDKRFFEQGDNRIPGIEKATAGDRLVMFVDQYADTFLEKALGYAFFKTFKAEIGSNPTSGIWFDIVKGAEYTKNGRLKKWKGLRQDGIYKSIVADYVYYFYMRNTISTSTPSGESVAKKENAVVTTPGYKMKDQWNYMVEQVHLLWEYLDNRVDDNLDLVYPDFDRTAVDCDEFQYVNMLGI